MSNDWIFKPTFTKAYEDAKAALCAKYQRAEDAISALEWQVMTSATTDQSDVQLYVVSLPAADCPSLTVFYVISNNTVLLVHVEEA